MSNTSQNNASDQSSYFPVWAPHLVMVAVILTGIVLAWGGAMLPFAFFVLFAAAMIGSTMLVEPRGLFLTVFSYPLWFFFGVLLIGLVITPSGGASYSLKTKVATAVYPAVEEYLWLAVPFIICAVISGIRWWLYRERIDRQRAWATQRRLRRSQADRSNQEITQQVRTRSTARAQSDTELADKASRTAPSNRTERTESSGRAEQLEAIGRYERTDQHKRPAPMSPREMQRAQVRTQAELRRSSAQRRRVTPPRPEHTPEHGSGQEIRSTERRADRYYEPLQQSHPKYSQPEQPRRTYRRPGLDEPLFGNHERDYPTKPTAPEAETKPTAPGVERRRYPIPPASRSRGSQPAPRRRRDTPRHYLEDDL